MSDERISTASNSDSNSPYKKEENTLFHVAREAEPDGDMSTCPHSGRVMSTPPTFEATPWEERLAASQAAFEEKQAKEKAERAELKQGRDWGLRRRHAARLGETRDQ